MPSSIQNETDNELIDNATQCVAAYNANPGDYAGVTQQMVDDLKAFKDAFIPEVALSVTKQNEARTQTQVKEAKRVPTETQLAMIRNLATAAHATPAALTAMGFTIGGSHAPATATRPVARVDTSQRLQHTIHFTDEATPDNKKRPRGTIGAGIYSKIDGPPPADPSECTFIAIDTATPYVIHYSGDDAGKMAHYMLRWHMRDGSDSPWSETISATITG